MKQEKINPAALVPMDLFAAEGPLRVELAYAGPQSFCGVLYRPDARLWLHEDLAAIVVLAAKLAFRGRGLRMVVYDGLRTVAAQALMAQSEIVKAHPHWLAGDSRVLSPPGAGGHPRAMAVDVSLETKKGVLVDMGTAFDELPFDGSGPAVNRAHRLFADLPSDVKENRRILQDAMTGAAKHLNLPLWPLPVEWWDFRFPVEVTNRYAPLDDADLPPQMRMTEAPFNASGPPDFPPEHFARKKASLLSRLANINSHFK
jgi:zinc D-Ala-D-Ala dipeptidase